MDFYEVVKKRRSYRIFNPDMPEKEKIEKILNAARLAPTWANKQGMHYIIVQDSEKVKKIWDAVGQRKKFIDAPMYIVGCITEKGSGKGGNGIKYYTVDFGICFVSLISIVHDKSFRYDGSTEKPKNAHAKAQRPPRRSRRWHEASGLS